MPDVLLVLQYDQKIFPGNRLAFVLYISGLGRRRRISDEELA